MDLYIRTLERKAATGDPEAVLHWMAQTHQTLRPDTIEVIRCRVPKVSLAIFTLTFHQMWKCCKLGTLPCLDRENCAVRTRKYRYWSRNLAEPPTMPW